MKHFLPGFFFFLAHCSAFAQQPDTRYFELRIYYCAPGKLDVLVDRFQNHTTKIFERLGMQNIGYWLPVTNNRNALYYILAYPNKTARKTSWEAFSADAEWKKVMAQAEASGKAVDSIKSIFMNASDILPMMNATSMGQVRVFELRTYTCFPGKLPNRPDLF